MPLQQLMPTAQGRSATTRPFFVLSDAAGHMPPKTKDDHKTESQCNLLHSNSLQHQQTNPTKALEFQQTKGNSGLVLQTE